MKPDIRKKIPQLQYLVAAVLVLAAILVYETSPGLLPVYGDAEIGEISDVTAESNSTESIPFRASKVDEMHYQISAVNNSSFSLYNLRFTLDADPSPYMRVTTLPPYWQWRSTAEEINGEFHVNTSGAAPGIYNITISAWNHEGGTHNHSGGASETFQIRIAR